ncbi:MAG: diguanylate cyclase [Actinomycetota bacterium]|nr:diguanylate cyclase [Actinomycetota bacterium]
MRAEITLLLTHDENSASLVAQQPSPGLDFLTATRLRMPMGSESLLVKAFEQGRPLLLTRRACREMELPALLPEIRVLDLLACPLEARGKKIGLLVLANKMDRRGYSRRDLELLCLLAPHISVFLDNALLFRRSEEKVAQLTSLIRVVDAIHTTSSLDQLYNLAMDVIRALFAPDKALINLVDAQSGMLRTVRNLGYGQEYAEKHLSHPFEPVADCFVLRSGDHFLCPDVESEKRCPNMVVSEDIRSVLCVPIRSGTKLYGILHMASHFERGFDEEDAALAKAIGEQIGVAVERARLFEEVSQLAITDELTGLYNIRHLKRVLGEEVKRSLRYGRAFSFIMLDIDYFKVYNDQHGHLRGDEVLRIMAGLLQQNVREVDTVFRYGGEEFSVIIPEVAKQEALNIAERIRRVVQDYVFPFEEFQPGGNLTVSMGISGFPEDAEGTEELIDRADRALYRAKLTGRNRICLYDPSLDREAFHPHVPQ